jgi:NADPH:quinone reductase-like Zn-dependent oxidoreductase
VRAVVKKGWGPRARLVVSDVPTPAAGPGEVLVGVHATSVTRGDVVLRKMPGWVARLFGVPPKRVLGHEFAGVVESVGEEVVTFEVGDRVFGTTSELEQGAHAEYVAVPADGILANIPEGVAYEEAAPVPVGAMTALHFLRAGGVVSGSRVLVNGASGSVGGFAVQIAKGMGAHVTGVARASNLELVASLGADEVIDYTTADFTEGDRVYDVVFDAAGKLSPKRVERVLSEQGRFVSTRTRREETGEELLAVRDLLVDGSLHAVIDRYYSLDQVPEAAEHIERGGKRGNVVVSLDG